jgi:hypothetical protein
MVLNRDQLLKAYPAPPQDFKEGVALTLRVIQTQAGQTPLRYARRLSFAPALAAILVLAMLTAGIAVGAHYGVFDFLGRDVGNSQVLPQAGELVQTNLGTLDLPHTLITAEEALYDGGSLQVVYSVQAKNLTKKPTLGDLYDPGLGLESSDSELSRALAADEVACYAGFDWFFINGEEHVMTNGSFGDATLDEETGKVYCYMNMQLASSGIVPKGDFTVALPVAGPIGDRKLLEFTMKAGVAQGARYAMENEREAVTVESAFVTPVRVYVNLRVEAKAGADPERAKQVLADWNGALLVDASGRKISGLVEVYEDIPEEGKGSDFHYVFLPAEAAEAYVAPIMAGDAGSWAADMSRAIRVR